MAGEDFVQLLSEPVNKLLSDNNKKTLSKLWNEYFLDLYNNRTEFIHDLALSNKKARNNLLKYTFSENYELAKNNLKDIEQNTNPWINLDENRLITLTKPEKTTRRNSCSSLLEATAAEKLYKNNILNGVFRLVVSMFQYLSYFEENNIDINLWNYCLNSLTFSHEFFFIGLLTIICQYTWTVLLLYNVIKKYHVSHSADIIMVTIISSIISLIYSYKTLKSYSYTRKLYKFRIQLFDDYPSIQLKKEDRDKLYFQSRKITMKRKHIVYNWWADFLSNCILPILIPVINIFIILSADSCIEAVLNSIAVFFIIQIDEDLYSINSWELEKKTINTIKWIISCVYTNHFPAFNDAFRNEFENWHHDAIRITHSFKNKKKTNRIIPIE